MTERIGISETDLRGLLDIVDRGRCGGEGEHVPESLLRDLTAVVANDDATFQVIDPYRHVGSVQDAESVVALAEDDPFWPAFWEHCAYPLQTGDYASVTRASDDLPGISAGAHWSTFLDESPGSGADHVIVSLPPAGATDRRLILWRDSGPAFSARDVQLLTLLRPHLIDVYERHQDTRTGAPELTLRQHEILRLVSDGQTNAQIARRLGLSEATVRKHLENSYARLGVTNRMAAVRRARRLMQAS